MKPRPRIRKFFKWGGLVVSALLASVFVWNSLNRHVAVSTPVIQFSVSRGRVMFFSPQGPHAAQPYALYFLAGAEPGFAWRYYEGTIGTTRYISIPLWPFVALSLATTAAAWRMDIIARRKSRLGKCPACGYDRTGLASNAPCPECNAKA
jgi:hypothetical protein